MPTPPGSPLPLRCAPGGTRELSPREVTLVAELVLAGAELAVNDGGEDWDELGGTSRTLHLRPHAGGGMTATVHTHTFHNADGMISDSDSLEHHELERGELTAWAELAQVRGDVATAQGDEDGGVCSTLAEWHATWLARVEGEPVVLTETEGTARAWSPGPCGGVLTVTPWPGGDGQSAVTGRLRARSGRVVEIHGTTFSQRVWVAAPPDLHVTGVHEGGGALTLTLTRAAPAPGLTRDVLGRPGLDVDGPPGGGQLQGVATHELAEVLSAGRVAAWHGGTFYTVLEPRQGGRLTVTWEDAWPHGAEVSPAVADALMDALRAYAPLRPEATCNDPHLQRALIATRCAADTEASVWALGRGGARELARGVPGDTLRVEAWWHEGPTVHAGNGMLCVHEEIDGTVLCDLALHLPAGTGLAEPYPDVVITDDTEESVLALPLIAVEDV